MYQHKTVRSNYSYHKGDVFAEGVLKKRFVLGCGSIEHRV